MNLFTALGTAFALASTALAQIAQYSPPSDKGVSYSVNVPDASAASDSGDIYFQIQAPASLQWVALGQGSSMEGANMFVMYADASGKNVTLSPREGKGEVMPLFGSSIQVFLLEGSGIANNVMTANVRCSSCASWDGGKMDFTSSKTNWLWAVKDGSPLNSDSVSATIQQHDDMDTFNFDLTKARGGSSLNPFVSDASTTGSASSSGAVPAATTAAAGYPAASASSSAGQSAGDGDSGSSDGDNSSQKTTVNNARIAHGTIMGLVFVIFFPAGAMIIRLFSFPGLVWVHAGIQVFAYIFALAGLGLGVYIGVVPEYQLNNYHPIIGLVVIGCLLIQPILGFIHHVKYGRNGEQTLWSTAHVWFGRSILTLGIINGGLGLMFAANTTKGEIAYGVVAGVVWLTWVAVMVWAALYKRGAEEGPGNGKYSGRSNGSPAMTETG